MLHDSTTFVSWATSLLTHLARTFFLYALILKEGNIVISRIFKAHFIHKFTVLSIYILFCISYHSLNPSSLLVLIYLRFPCYDLISNGCLHSDLKHLPWYGVFESLTHGFPCAVRTVSVKKTHPSELGMHNMYWTTDNETFYIIGY